jgi:hypothetical protein
MCPAGIQTPGVSLPRFSLSHAPRRKGRALTTAVELESGLERNLSLDVAARQRGRVLLFGRVEPIHVPSPKRARSGPDKGGGGGQNGAIHKDKG